MVKQERAARTRTLVLRAGAEVIASRGYEAATIAQILEQAGVTKGAMYFHFSSKEALARAVIEEQTSVVYSPATATSLRTQDMIDFSYQVARRLQSDPLLKAGTRIAVETSFGEQPMVPYQHWGEIIRQLLVEAHRAGELLPAVDPAETADVFVSSYLGVQLVSQATANRTDLLDRVGALWEHLLPAMVAPGTLGRLRPRGTPGALDREVSADPGATRAKDDPIDAA